MSESGDSVEKCGRSSNCNYFVSLISFRLERELTFTVKRPVSLPQEDEGSVAAVALVWVEFENGGVGLTRDTTDEVVCEGSRVNETSLLGNPEIDCQVIEVCVGRPPSVGNAEFCSEVLADTALDADAAFVDVALLVGCANDDV